MVNTPWSCHGENEHSEYHYNPALLAQGPILSSWHIENGCAGALSKRSCTLHPCVVWRRVRENFSGFPQTQTPATFIEELRHAKRI